jgi:cytochrome c-type biogenesis protein
MQTSGKPAGFFGAMLVGIAFAFGWTPCIGPILSAILLVASTQDTVGQGVQLLAVYSAGLGVPFILTSMAINKFLAASARIRRHYHTIEVVSGVFMVVVGVLIFTNRFTVIAQLLTPYFPTF